jgi:hypothetical protein
MEQEEQEEQGESVVRSVLDLILDRVLDHVLPHPLPLRVSALMDQDENQEPLDLTPKRNESSPHPDEQERSLDKTASSAEDVHAQDLPKETLPSQILQKR